METIRCPRHSGHGAGCRRKCRQLPNAPAFLSIDCQSAKSLKLSLVTNTSSSLRVVASSSPVNNTSGNGFSDNGDGWQQHEGVQSRDIEPKSRSGDKEQEASHNDPWKNEERSDELTRTDSGNGLAPGLSRLGEREDTGIPSPGSTSAATASGGIPTATPGSQQAPGGTQRNGGRSSSFPTGWRVPETNLGLPGIKPSGSGAKSGAPGVNRGVLGMSGDLGAVDAFPVPRSPSPVFSDLSEDEADSVKDSRNGSWFGQMPTVGSNGGSSSAAGWPQGRSSSGLVKGMGPRGRQSVLGSAVMQGSRFEPGHGDTSWINSMSPDWFPVIPLWQATAKAALGSDQFLTHMSQGWRLLLLSTDSVTTQLQLMTTHRISVDCLEMRAIGHSLLGVPPGTALVAGPRVQRQVLLKTQEGLPLAYAASWWAEYEAKVHLQEVHKAIWLALQEQRMELFRSLECLYYGHSRELERLFGRNGPFWARHYLFYHNGRPLTLIYEVFSPALDEWLGDSALPEDLYLP